MPSFRYVPFALSAAALAGALAACGSSNKSSLGGLDFDFPSVGVSVGATSGSSGSGGSIQNQGGNAPTTGYDYKTLCGGGCTPGTAMSPSCMLSGTGGAGGGAAAAGSCQLGFDGMYVSGVCGPTGAAQAGSPCLSTHDCAPGFGCVASGVCRPYCCGDLEACPAMTYCAPQPMSPGDAPQAKTPPSVPVCVAVEPCTLLDDLSCQKDGQTCTIVRADGTTSCVDAGAGKDGDACPCAAGYVCSFAHDKCLKLCHTKNKGDCPAGWQCSGGSKPYPPGYGVCVEL
jgi:hypothetical protein